MILDKIVEKKLIYINNKKIKTPIEIIKQQAETTHVDRRSFKDAIRKSSEIAIIGEIKKASPSKGIIKEDFDVSMIAGQYSQANIQALSVLTEKDFFQGDEEYLIMAKKQCKMPVLRKDFIIDEWQIYESYLIKADAILLIAAILDDIRLFEFYRIARSMNLDVLVEVHDERELGRVLKIDPEIIGINNRNLEDFTVTLETTRRLYDIIPKGKIVVGESGIHTNEDVKFMKDIGVDALLIGESLMRADNIVDKIAALRGLK